MTKTTAAIPLLGGFKAWRPHFLIFLLVTLAPAWGGDLKKDYFAGTKHGAWSEYLLTSPDGSKSHFSYQRGKDDDGHPVVEIQVKILEGPGKDSKTRNVYTLPKDFSFERDGLNVGRFAEKMSMSYGETEMVVDATTLEAIRNGTKDFTGALTFEAAETMEGRACDRYAYTVKIGGPLPTQEAGRLWLDPAAPFAIVRQSARITDPAGKLITEYDMRLTGAGLNQALAAAPPPPMEKKAAPEPSQVTLAEGFEAGRVGMELDGVAGSVGRRLSLRLLNKTGAELTVSIAAGESQFEVDTPLHTLQIVFAKNMRVRIPAGQKAEAIIVEQRGQRGMIEGHCSLSVYEGTPLYTGSVTVGSLPK